MSGSPVPKALSILAVVNRLVAHFGNEAITVRDFWEADLCAIGISKPTSDRPLAYISTFGKSPGRYFLSLESPPAPGSEVPFSPAGDYDDIVFEQLVEHISKHLGIAPR